MASITGFHNCPLMAKGDSSHSVIKTGPKTAFWGWKLSFWRNEFISAHCYLSHAGGRKRSRSKGVWQQGQTSSLTGCKLSCCLFDLFIKVCLQRCGILSRQTRVESQMVQTAWCWASQVSFRLIKKKGYLYILQAWSCGLHGCHRGSCETTRRFWRGEVTHDPNIYWNNVKEK